MNEHSNRTNQAGSSKPGGRMGAESTMLMLCAQISRNNILASIVAIIILFIATPACLGQDREGSNQIIGTGSPRQTFQSFLVLTKEFESALAAYRNNRTSQIQGRVQRIGSEFFSLLDLSAAPEASRREQGIQTVSFLLDIFGRIDLPAPEQIPTAESFDSNPEKPAKWRIPNTPIEIVRVKQGPREGEFLFSGRTALVARQFFNEIQNTPLRSTLPIKSWSQTLPQLTGPMIPGGLVSVLPGILKRSWLDTPIWKLLAVIVLSILAIGLVLTWHRIVNLSKRKDGLLSMLRRLLTPVMIILVVGFLGNFAAYEINVLGTFAVILAYATTLAKFLAAAWIFWLVALIAAELVIRSPTIPDQGLNANLLRLSARIVGIVGGAVILAYAGNALGLPVFSLIAGLGVGGLAVALAIRPTLENLVGGLILYADRPVRVGDYCMFNNHVGTIESIGVRSTQIRALDRTLISVPNAKFADMEIINWAHCDQMLIDAVIGVRYETEPDQLRYVLATLREMFHAHPKIDKETVRVRFSGFGASSLDISIRVYALTREWNEFHAIREDIFLRVNEIVRHSGTSFAFPSQTLYVRRDEGLDDERSKATMDEVDVWRRSGKLPFPRMSASRVDELAGTLDFPPRGSPDFLSPEAPETDSSERLSAPVEPDAPDDVQPPSGPEHSEDRSEEPARKT